jgi:hypothetical protein
MEGPLRALACAGASNRCSILACKAGPTCLLRLEGTLCNSRSGSFLACGPRRGLRDRVQTFRFPFSSPMRISIQNETGRPIVGEPDAIAPRPSLSADRGAGGEFVFHCSCWFQSPILNWFKLGEGSSTENVHLSCCSISRTSVAEFGPDFVPRYDHWRIDLAALDLSSPALLGPSLCLFDAWISRLRGLLSTRGSTTDNPLCHTSVEHTGMSSSQMPVMFFPGGTDKTPIILEGFHIHYNIPH